VSKRSARSGELLRESRELDARISLEISQATVAERVRRTIESACPDVTGPTFHPDGSAGDLLRDEFFGTWYWGHECDMHCPCAVPDARFDGAAEGISLGLEAFKGFVVSDAVTTEHMGIPSWNHEAYCMHREMGIPVPDELLDRLAPVHGPPEPSRQAYALTRTGHLSNLEARRAYSAAVDHAGLTVGDVDLRMPAWIVVDDLSGLVGRTMRAHLEAYAEVPAEGYSTLQPDDNG
jgi:hypothetical protein